ncbi:hypothetical protein CBOM_02229 [Ceraceosorus bombacis]|uniref:Uncharacterized protein n=1 Tax=Ceraceosorus bombacis TaxID=401625 RepID=A0A0P1BES2_9BASI|nr:hypothetical protein CBOM_02229 [Ceraceosorus bombacis]
MRHSNCALAFLASLLFSDALANPLRNLCRNCLVHEPTPAVGPSEGAGAGAGAAESFKFGTPDASERDKLWRQDLEAISRSSLHALRSAPRSAVPRRFTPTPSPSRSFHDRSFRSANSGASPTNEVAGTSATASSRNFAHYTTPRTSVARQDHGRSPGDSRHRGYASGSDAPTSPGLRASSSSALFYPATASPHPSTTPSSREARLFAQTQRELRTALSDTKALQDTSKGRRSRRLERTSTGVKGKSPDGKAPQSLSDRWSGASQDQMSTPFPSRQAPSDDSDRSSRWSASDRYSQLRSLSPSPSPSPSPPHSIRRHRDAYYPSPQRSPMHSPLGTPSNSRPPSPSPQRFARLSPASAVHGDRNNVPNVVHPLGYAHPDFDSHGLYGQVNRNLEEHTHALQYDGHVKGTSLRGDSVAMWAKPGSHFRHFAAGWMEQRRGSGQSQAPGQGKLLMVGPNNQFFDAVHHGKVVGSWKLPPSMSKQKGVYDIERNPVHVHGPKARPNNQEALQTLQEMEAQHAHNSHRRRPSDSDDDADADADADDGMDFKKPSPAGSRRASRSSSPPHALASSVSASVSPARSAVTVSSTRHHSPAASPLHAHDSRDTHPRVAAGTSSTSAKLVPDASPLLTATSKGEARSIEHDAQRLGHDLKSEVELQHSRTSSPASSLGSADSFAFRVGPLLGAENGQAAEVANGEVASKAGRREHAVDQEDDSKQSAQRGDDRDPIQHADG